MKKVIIVLFLFSGQWLFSQTDVPAKDSLEWQTDLLKAQELSVASNKPIFALFTGSDWCVWCKKLDKDVFAKQEFITWAKKNVILLYLDFPRNKELSPELKQQNAELQQTFQIKGYPTAWIFYLNKDEATKKMNISALGSLGYPQNPEAGKEALIFIDNANNILANRMK